MKLQDYKASHVSMWTWLAEHPGKDKEDWPGWQKVRLLEGKYRGEFIPYSCFLCGWFKEKCSVCPLAIKFGSSCKDRNSRNIYYKWLLATKRGKKNKARRLAIMIRDCWNDDSSVKKTPLNFGAIANWWKMLWLDD